MNLTRYTDYALRVLLYLSARPQKRVSIDEIARFYDISKDHLIKVVHHLGKLKYIITVRGRNGGIQLAPGALDARVGDVVLAMEPNFHLVECFDLQNNRCRVTPVCNLKGVLLEAHREFMEVLNRHTLKDLISDTQTALALIEEIHPL